jgi:hypothetical protein
MEVENQSFFWTFFYRLFTDFNYKPFAGWGTRPEISTAYDKVALGQFDGWFVAGVQA